MKLVIRTWNIQSGRNACLETALQVLWALGKVGVDLCFLTETKLTEDILHKFFLGLSGFSYQRHEPPPESNSFSL